ncbi:Scr1 family TA system antitoxin-like transcriptional regulator [Nonomuraea sp. NEAU-A123]|uniref:Scr1 family TA system antitoxin-like transcriptional regulator n=1 Tax=Nonomuraea sp. NEAU-A123 TaxID=2839649 RepID=UPI0027E2052F|nr:Scr1 family TA system antitoxin-like transcriptional regulator [Nonomuraea sp. NEAU-A123]
MLARHRRTGGHSGTSGPRRLRTRCAATCKSRGHPFNFEELLIPGLLQTADYYRAYLATRPTSFGSDEIDRKIAFRMARQERMLRKPNEGFPT